MIHGWRMDARRSCHTPCWCSSSFNTNAPIFNNIANDVCLAWNSYTTVLNHKKKCTMQSPSLDTYIIDSCLLWIQYIWMLYYIHYQDTWTVHLKFHHTILTPPIVLWLKLKPNFGEQIQVIFLVIYSTAYLTPCAWFNPHIASFYRFYLIF
jgi:hypothetical protein